MTNGGVLLQCGMQRQHHHYEWSNHSQLLFQRESGATLVSLIRIFVSLYWCIYILIDLVLECKKYLKKKQNMIFNTLYGIYFFSCLYSAHNFLYLIYKHQVSEKMSLHSLLTKQWQMSKCREVYDHGHAISVSPGTKRIMTTWRGQPYGQMQSLSASARYGFDLPVGKFTISMNFLTEVCFFRYVA